MRKDLRNMLFTKLLRVFLWILRCWKWRGRGKENPWRTNTNWCCFSIWINKLGAIKKEKRSSPTNVNSRKDKEPHQQHYNHQWITKRQQKLDLFDNYLNFNFLSSKNKFELELESDAKTGKGNKVTKRKNFIKDRLRFFNHCYSDEVRLNQDLPFLRQELYEKCDKYEIWTDSPIQDKNKWTLINLSKPVCFWC